MTMGPSVRKLVLSLHLSLSVGWIGGVIAFLALAVVASRGDEQTLRGSWIAMESVGRLALVPLSISSLATGLVLSVGTKCSSAITGL